MISGEDLVDWQLVAAAEERLKKSRDSIACHGHAIEARVYAEDPAQGFLPTVGDVHRLRLPELPGVRVDTALEEGARITPHYDPLLAKVIAQGLDRDEARRRLVAALEEFVLLGVTTNTSFLIDVLSSEAFRDGRTFTHTLEEELLERVDRGVPDDAVVLAGVALAQSGRGYATGGPAGGAGGAEGAAPVPSDPFQDLGGFRLLDTAGEGAGA
jgi:acetyl/propionyl-CoA carboxylase alpha subunit